MRALNLLCYFLCVFACKPNCGGYAPKIMTRLANYLAQLQRFGIAPGLERIGALLARAGNPHLQYPHVLIGGTNGKGSTAEYTARALLENGRRIGLYTSPHLYEWNERIRVLPGAGTFEGAIGDADLDDLLHDAMPHIEAVARDLGQPTEFEVMTFLGLWHFARTGVDAAVLEVGLGGKWDATNATNPQVSAVTHVALDHMDRLGDTLELIAADKVCIARANHPFLTAETKPQILDIFRAHCARIGADFQRVQTPASADFQQINRALGLQIARALARGCGWELPVRAPESGIVGRAEIIGQNPRLLIDGANNPDGAARLANYLRDQLHLQRSQTILVVGILADKNWREMIEILAPLARHVICTQSDSPRALPAAELAACARQFSDSVEISENVTAAIARAKALAKAPETIVVTGSFTLIGEVPRAKQ